MILNKVRLLCFVVLFVLAVISVCFFYSSHILAEHTQYAGFGGIGNMLGHQTVMESSTCTFVPPKTKFKFTSNKRVHINTLFYALVSSTIQALKSVHFPLLFNSK